MEPKICVVGLGYVGLPLAVEFGKQIPVKGFDISKERISQLKSGIDPSGEVSKEQLSNTEISYSHDPKVISESDFIIVAVPTPITSDLEPDLRYVKKASETVGKNLLKGSIVVYESTVYPGVTEDICAPILEKASGMECGQDFRIGYSPERINPGDKEHTVDKIVKIVSGMDKATLDKVADVYSTIVTAGVHKASSIKVAEAAKVIENIQRDLNIALINELSVIFSKMDINTREVIEAAGTKWNFHKYHPGLVGGHCIGVDPYYLTHKAEQLGYKPKVILAGRNINEHMPEHVAGLLKDALSEAGKDLKDTTILLLGLTFKENVSDYRNSKALDLIRNLRNSDANALACEPMLSKAIVADEFGVEKVAFDSVKEIDAVCLVTPHSEFKNISLTNLKQIFRGRPVLVEVRPFFNKEEAFKLGFIHREL